MKVAGVILAGGRSTRMGGVDKAALDLAGTTLLDNAVSRLAPQVGELAVSTNVDRPGLGPHVPRLHDRAATFEGPLAGVVAGLEWAASRQQDTIVTIAVDTPFFPVDLVARLAGGNLERVRVARSNGRHHPIIALWPIGALAPLAAFLESPESRRVMTFLEAFGMEAVDFPTEPFDPFFNVNTPEDLAAARRLAGWTGS